MRYNFAKTTDKSVKQAVMTIVTVIASTATAKLVVPLVEMIGFKIDEELRNTILLGMIALISYLVKMLYDYLKHKIGVRI